MKHLFIVNPKAGKVDAREEIRRKAEKLCDALQEPFEVLVTEKPGDATEMARTAGMTGQLTRLYACGGDGTLYEIVNGAIGYDNLAVTSIPCGSGNDFIKHFSNPSAFFDWKNFLDTRESRIDVMCVGDAVSVNVCSVGFDARIGTNIDAYRRLPLLGGQRAYHASVVVNLIRGVAKPCRVEVCGEVIDEKLSLVCVCNGSWYGGSYNPIPEAKFDDGILDVLVVKKVSRLMVAKLISEYQKGGYKNMPDQIRHFRTDHVRITTPEAEPVNLDGELIMSSDVNIQIEKGALPLFAPRAAWK